jgi:hypothetical protein
VPFFVSWPAKYKPAVVSEPVWLCDFFPTAVSLAGLSPKIMIPMVFQFFHYSKEKTVNLIRNGHSISRETENRLLEWGPGGLIAELPTIKQNFIWLKRILTPKGTLPGFIPKWFKKWTASWIIHTPSPLVLDSR